MGRKICGISIRHADCALSVQKKPGFAGRYG
jgi:hypothetical protein